MSTNETTTRLSAQERRELILRKSAELFAELGYHDASTKKLATASGITEPVLYQHFSSKKKLFITVVRDFGQLFSKSFKQQTAHSQDSSEVVILHQTLIDYYELSTKHIEMRNIIFEAMAFRDEDISVAVHQNLQDIAIFVYELLETANKAKRIAPNIDVEAATWNYMSMILLVHVSLLSDGYYGHNQTSFQRMADFWLNAVKKR
ncbi:MAG: TetR/AcrR family transcriptional regulator [Chloroflexota bacterium]